MPEELTETRSVKNGYNAILFKLFQKRMLLLAGFKKPYRYVPGVRSLMVEHIRAVTMADSTPANRLCE
jgi:hypothetical protein